LGSFTVGGDVGKDLLKQDVLSKPRTPQFLISPYRGHQRINQEEDTEKLMYGAKSKGKNKNKGILRVSKYLPEKENDQIKE
jgi:hypothetical protein